MKDSKQSMPGVRRIYARLCSSLPRHLMLTGICGGSVAMFRDDLVEIPFCGTPSFTREVKPHNGARAYTSTIEFRSAVDIPTAAPLAFVIEQVNGTTLLIGAREPNYPIVKFSETSGAPGGDPAIRTYTITHTDIFSGIPVIL